MEPSECRNWLSLDEGESKVLGPGIAPNPGTMATVFKSYCAQIWGGQEEGRSPQESFCLHLAAGAL